MVRALRIAFHLAYISGKAQTSIVATKQFGISRATMFRMLAAGDLVRHRRRGSTAT